MQAAYWVWGHSPRATEGVSAHLYAEFDTGSLDPQRLQDAIGRLFAAHPALSVAVDADGMPFHAAPPSLEVEDLRDLPLAGQERRLEMIRQRKSHQRLALDQGAGMQLSLSLLGPERARLHLDLDMITADPSCFGQIVEDLALAYEGEEPSRRATPPLRQTSPEDRDWWRDRLATLFEAPALPEGTGGQPASLRLFSLLTTAEAQALRQVARRSRVTFSALMMTLFAAHLGKAIGQERFRLNLPTFLRDGGDPAAVGDISDLLVLGIEIADLPFASLCRRQQEDLFAALSHRGYSGTSVLRDLSRLRGTIETAPVVFTAGLDLSGRVILGPVASRLFGPMVWVMSQAPQVALDVQLGMLPEGLLVNWDLRTDRVSEAWARELFDRFVASARYLAANPEAAELPLAAWQDTARRPLTMLQQAYLMGREAHLPLGGVAMQKFREYRGELRIADLRARLAELMSVNPALRTRIDPVGLTCQEVGMELPFEVTDLRHLPLAEAKAQVDGLRDEYAHALFELDGPLWHVRAFLMPDDRDPVVVFARFDALILDGQSICSLLARMFDAAPLKAQPSAARPRLDPAARRRAAAYWRDYLAGLETPPRLPWLAPLEGIDSSRYRRQSLRLPRDVLGQLRRIGAGQGLFLNSVLTAILLDVLARWTTDGQLCVAVPVTPPDATAGGAGTQNASTFIPLRFDATRGTLSERAAACQADMMAGLEQTAFSGPEIGRLLMNAGSGALPLPVVLTNGMGWERPAPGPMRLIRGLTQTPQVALDLRLALDAEGGLELNIDHAARAIDEALAQEMLAAMGRAIRAVCGRGALELAAHEVLALDHYRYNAMQDMLAEPEVDFLSAIARNLFDGDCAQTALHYGTQSVSYAQLGRMVASAIGGLRVRGLAEGDVVAICLPRGPQHLALQLACALEGLIWVPIDASAPVERRRYLLENCDPALIVASDEVDDFPSILAETLLTIPSDARPADPDTLLRRSLSQEPAYYLYTSGTTGRPKCVVLTNRATANTIAATRKNWQIGPKDVTISVTPLHHDMSVFDLFGTLSAGATLVMPDREKDAIHWCRLIRRHGVTIWCSVPAILEMLLACRQPGELDSLRLVAQGGDYIKPATISTLRGLLPQTRMVSLGGPTETTIWSIWHEIGADDTGTIPYGRALPGNSYFICTDTGEHCPAGVVGRIHTAGVNLALGYLSGGRIGGEDFVTLNDDRGLPVRAFRTGDLGYYRDDGSIVFAGRVGGYVKIRGVRLSLADVEIGLIGHPSIRHVMAVDCGEGADVTLAALYVADAAIPVADLRIYAREHLPESHIPSHFQLVETLPLSANGKSDRHRARQMLSESAPPATMALPAPAAGNAAQQVLDICLGVIGPAQDANPDQPLLSLGLRPVHLKPIAEGLSIAYGKQVRPTQLSRCRTARDMSRLCLETA
ncbi:peptide synthetase [Paracoccus methylarcula]|uniref:Peptide synthetase n=2 Tax=Paracoccus methylarcula TaxID=72022 RepID=A0A422R2G5_9RHOB|nr:peptide synthetase [Paracoccus methylarcula]